MKLTQKEKELKALFTEREKLIEKKSLLKNVLENLEEKIVLNDLAIDRILKKKTKS